MVFLHGTGFRDCYSSYFLAVAFVYWGLCTAHIVYFPLFFGICTLLLSYVTTILCLNRLIEMLVRVIYLVLYYTGCSTYDMKSE